QIRQWDLCDEIASRSVGARRNDDRIARRHGHDDSLLAHEASEKQTVDLDTTDEIESPAANQNGIDPAQREERAFSRSNPYQHATLRGRECARQLGIESVELVSKVARAQNPPGAVLHLQHVQPRGMHRLLGPVEQVGPVARVASNYCEPE